MRYPSPGRRRFADAPARVHPRLDTGPDPGRGRGRGRRRITAAQPARPRSVRTGPQRVPGHSTRTATSTSPMPTAATPMPSSPATPSTEARGSPTTGADSCSVVVRTAARRSWSPTRMAPMCARSPPRSGSGRTSCRRTTRWSRPEPSMAISCCPSSHLDGSGTVRDLPLQRHPAELLGRTASARWRRADLHWLIRVRARRISPCTASSPMAPACGPSGLSCPPTRTTTTHCATQSSPRTARRSRSGTSSTRQAIRPLGRTCTSAI